MTRHGMRARPIHPAVLSWASVTAIALTLLCGGLVRPIATHRSWMPEPPLFAQPLPLISRSCPATGTAAPSADAGESERHRTAFEHASHSVASVSSASLQLGPGDERPSDSRRASRWQWPLSPRPHIQRYFDPPPQPWLPGHRGIDLDAQPGQVVTAVAEGKVHFVGWVVDRPVVSIEHPDGFISTYEPVASDLTEGDPILTGENIGTIATGSNCTATCLRLGARRGDDYLNPLRLLSPATIILKPLTADHSAAVHREDHTPAQLEKTVTLLQPHSASGPHSTEAVDHLSASLALPSHCRPQGQRALRYPPQHDGAQASGGSSTSSIQLAAAARHSRPLHIAGRQLGELPTSPRSRAPPRGAPTFAT